VDPGILDHGIVITTSNTCYKAQIPLHQLSPKLPHGESHGHKSRKSRIQTISTCQDICDKDRDKSTTNPFVSL